MIHVGAFSLIQIILGGILLFRVLALDSPEKFTHRLLLFVFATIGCLSFTTAVFYIQSFVIVHSITLSILSLTSLVVLHLVQWDISRLCNNVKNYISHI